MTIKELIEALEKFPSDAEVKVGKGDWNGDDGDDIEDVYVINRPFSSTVVIDTKRYWR